MNRIRLYHNTRISRLWISSLLCILAFAGIAALVASNKEIGFDIAVITWIQGLESPFLTEAAKGFTFLGSTSAVIVLCAVILLFLYVVLRHRRELLLFMSVMLGTELWNLLLKHSFKRVRPDIHRLIEISGYSFPSGHSMAAFSLYGILTYLLWRHIPYAAGRFLLLAVSGVMILSIGLSRIYLGVHYPSDVLGGFLASCAWMLFAIGIYELRNGRSAS